MQKLKTLSSKRFLPVDLSVPQNVVLLTSASQPGRTSCSEDNCEVEDSEGFPAITHYG